MSSDAPTPDATPTTDAPLFAGRYLLFEKLGEGGMGAVFRARDAKLERPVALKMLPEGSAPDAGALERFRREAKALARLSHPGIIQAYDSGEEAGRPFLVMELVEGRSLAALLRGSAGVAPARAADFAYQAALALHHAHKTGLVHRDVKPSNLLLSADGRVRLLDLGLARFLQDQIGEAHLTRTGHGMGTPDYCPPEQFRDAHKADVRSDVYSLGCTLYHLIAGRVPFPGSSFSEKVEAHETKEPAPLEEVCPEVPAGLALTVRRMMAKRPADRFQSMAEVAEALMPHVAGSSASFPQIRNSATWDGSRLATMPALPRRSPRVLLAAAGAALAVLLVAGTLLTVGLAAGWFRPTEPRVVQNDDPVPVETEKAPAVAVDTGKAPLPDTPPKKEEAKKEEPRDPNVLTVAQKPGAAQHQTIGAALAAVKARQTIRVLDNAVYRESLRIADRTDMAGITLETTGGATLALESAGERSLLLDIAGVPDVTVRGFRLRATGTPRSALVAVRGACPGLLLERLELTASGSPATNGVEVGGSAGAAPDRAPAVIRDCVFRGFGLGTLFLARPGTSFFGTAVRDCLFTECEFGVQVAGGSARDIQVVGNRFRGIGIAALQFLLLAENAEDLLIANNTFFQSAAAFRLWDRAIHGKHVQVRNNLMLSGEGMDMLVIDAIDANDTRGPGDGAAVAAAYRISHNWREGKAPANDAKGWIPPDPKKGDVFKEKIGGVNRDPKSPDFLRPDKESPLATEGAGNDDPSLPRYVGALPPEGAEPWDWDRAGRMPKGAQLLTVSKDSKDNAKYDSIGDALKDAKPWATIRVLDDGVYDESVVLDDPEKHEGIVLEAPRHATLRLTAGRLKTVLIRAVPHVRVAGFRLRELKADRGSLFVGVTGHAPGTLLSGLDLDGTGNVDGILLNNVRTSPEEPPVVVRSCSVHVPYDSIRISGPIDATDSAQRSSGIVVRDCRAWGGARGICLIGAVARVQVTGNVAWDFKLVAFQVQDLPAGSGSILIANNTAFASNTGFRIWDDPPYEKLEPGQVEFANNLLFGCTSGDMQYVLKEKAGQTRGNTADLNSLWRFHHNTRDAQGDDQELLIPVAGQDRVMDKIDLVSRQPGHAGFMRPASASPLASQGAGTKEPALPAYIGALPREGDPAWDWDRTWRARAKKANDKAK